MIGFPTLVLPSMADAVASFSRRSRSYVVPKAEAVVKMAVFWCELGSYWCALLWLFVFFVVVVVPPNDDVNYLRVADDETSKTLLLLPVLLSTSRCFARTMAESLSFQLQQQQT